MWLKEYGLTGYANCLIGKDFHRYVWYFIALSLYYCSSFYLFIALLLIFSYRRWLSLYRSIPIAPFLSPHSHIASLLVAPLLVAPLLHLFVPISLLLIALFQVNYRFVTQSFRSFIP